MTSWKTYKLSDITIMRNGKKRPQTQGVFPVYGGNGIMDYADCFNAENTIIVGRVGAYCGNVYQCKGKCWVSDNAISVSANELVDDNYLYYLMSSLDFHHHHIGGAQPLMTQDIIGGFEISLPPLEEQRRIAGILGAIDDKIENNRRINTNLELQAQALYKQWFVDNRCDDWVEIKLGEIIEISKKSITPSQFGNTIFEHYSLPAYDDGKQPTFDRGEDIKSSKFVIGRGMFLFSKLNPRIKRIWLPDIGTEHAICSTEFIPYKPKRVDMLGLCYSIVNSEHFYEYVLSLTNGSTGSHQRFHPIDTLEYSLYIPSESHIGTFEDLVMPMYKEILRNRKENRRLATLRDTLLPKLMNGEIKTE